MPAMPSPKILAFVEGMMERIFISTNFRYVELVPVQNGGSWTSAMMANQITSKYVAKNYAADLVLVWIDCEKRGCTAAVLRNDIHTALVSKGAPAHRTHVCILDRMTENLILSDEIMIRTEFGDQNYAYTSEGANGKSALKQMYQNIGVNYKEVSHGVALLRKMRLHRTVAACQAASDLKNALQFPCWWVW